MFSSDLVRSVLDSAPDALVIIDASGTIVFANHQVSPLFGYAASEIVGKQVELLLPERFQSRHIVHRRNYTANVRARPMGVGQELYARRKDGTEFPVEISLSPMGNKGQLLAAASIRDVTDRRTIERELKEAREAAERANQAKSRFLATASHDLRQPLQTLALLNGALRRMVKEPQLADALAQEEQAIGTMSRLLNTLLDISKLESGAIKANLTDFAIAWMFAGLRSEFAGLAHDKGLKLEVDLCAEHIHSDASLVEQVLRNLLSNAIKYTQQGCVQLRCLRYKQSVCVQVSDTGIGIPQDALRHIYDEFYQVDVAANASRDGYGLGLSIVNRIVQLLGLKLEVCSELGKGSTFSLTLPLGRGHANERLTSPAHLESVAHGPAAQTHILLVEDEPGVRRATRTLFMSEGYSVSDAGSLGEAVRRAAEQPNVAAVVTDYHLANGETGIDVIAAVRKQLGADLRAILVTGDTSVAVRDMAHDERLRIASKPIDADELLTLLHNLLAG